jgi:hypothetical protein
MRSTVGIGSILGAREGRVEWRIWLYGLLFRGSEGNGDWREGGSESHYLQTIKRAAGAGVVQKYTLAKDTTQDRKKQKRNRRKRKKERRPSGG